MSGGFRQAVAVRSLENVNGQGGRSLETICRFNGALLAVVEGYVVAVGNAREADAHATGKEAPREDSGRIRSLDEDRDVAIEPRELIDIDENGAHYEDEGSRDLVDLNRVRALLPEDQAKWLTVWIRRKGKARHPKCAVRDLAEEYGVDRATIWRWCVKGQLLMDDLMERHGPSLLTGEPQ